MEVELRYTCLDCGWTGEVLGERGDSEEQCCPNCDSDNISVE